MTNAARCAAIALFACFGTAVACAQDTAALVAQLGSDEPEARSAAYSQLLQQHDAAAIPLLGKALPKFTAEAQRLGLVLLQQQPLDAVRGVYAKLATDDAPMLRIAALAVLARAGEQERLQPLAKAVAAAPAPLRRHVLDQLYGIQDAAVLAAVRGYLTADASRAVATGALSLLVRGEAEPSAETLAAARGLLAAADGETRTTAMAVLAAGDAAIAAEFAQQVRKQPASLWNVLPMLPRTRPLPRALLEAIAELGAAAPNRHQLTEASDLLRGPAPDLAIAMLRSALGAKDAEVQKGALDALSALPGGLDDKALRTMLGSGTADLQLVAAASLRRRDDPSGLVRVVALAQLPGAHRAEAARVLGGFRSREVVPPLLQLLDDGDAGVRVAAWQSLGTVWRDLFPYRRFDFATAGYDPNGADRTGGLATLRRWWDAAQAGRAK